MFRVLRILFSLMFTITLWIIFLAAIDCLPDPTHLAISSSTNPAGYIDSPLQSIQRTRDIFYGVSTALPGTFDRIFRKWFLAIMSSTTTSTAVTTAQPLVTTAIPSVTEAASAVRAGVLAGAGARALIVTVICTVLIIGSYCQLW